MSPADRSATTAPPRRPRGLRRAVWVVLGLLLLAGIGAGAWFFAAKPAPIRYTTEAVTRGTVERSVTATGTVNPELTVIVGTYVSGVIESVSCDYNTVVKRGQVCARIDPRPYQATVDQDRANLAVAKAQREKDAAALIAAKAQDKRLASLVARNFTSQTAADEARSAYGQARAQVDLDKAVIAQREAQLKAAEINLGYTEIVSPVDGVVVSRDVTRGQTVAASFQTPTLFLIATDLTRMQVDTNVSESDIGMVKDGDPARFTVGAFPERAFQGKVTQVRQSPQMVQNVVTYDVVVSVDNRDLALKPGMTASVQVITARRDKVMRVPVAALRFEPALGQGGKRGTDHGSGREVYILRDGKPVAVPVTVGIEDESFAEITGGDLRDGARVIVGESRPGQAARRPSRVPRF